MPTISVNLNTVTQHTFCRIFILMKKYSILKFILVSSLLLLTKDSGKK
ncbi:hypothetical protein [Pontibacter anaerobius]|uniref:Uncharacterized protein n=1 Tax=Pontibacter anaerobius TaxID=2993940 RepID=A0ABT3RFF8_9BACT|nr:hypothetical protein [Pontibacter anaerobius]MCX2740573.1 hypothetical protein [Pontibacter anaerobius]